jgi:hypothetical protein
VNADIWEFRDTLSDDEQALFQEVTVNLKDDLEDELRGFILPFELYEYDASKSQLASAARKIKSDPVYLKSIRIIEKWNKDNLSNLDDIQKRHNLIKSRALAILNLLYKRALLVARNNAIGMKLPAGIKYK